MFLKEYAGGIQALRGVGPKLAAALQKLNITTIADLCLHFPRDYIDRSNIDLIKDVLQKKTAHVKAEVIAHDYFGWGRKKTLKVFIEDESGTAVLICFGRPFLESVLVPGKKILVSGGFTYKYGEIQSSNFEFENFDKGTDLLPIIPVYPLTTGISPGYMRNIMKAALKYVGNDISEELPQHILHTYDFPSKAAALKTIHFPQDMKSLDKAKKYFIYEELFYLEFIIGRRSKKRKIIRKKRNIPGSPVQGTGSPSPVLEHKIRQRLPFTLTSDQEKVIREIKEDLLSEYPMSRLLQGDVGCGKTLVALIAASFVIEAGEQAAFCAPTELLARQHAENIARLLEPLGIRIAFLSGNVKGEARKHMTQALGAGKIDLLIGTHALFSRDIHFKNLGFVIIDEQHRFGVMQRLELMNKGTDPDLLLMTATPIPRTLALTAFGDLDISTIKTLPLGRKPVITHLTKEGNEYKVYNRVREELKRGRQAYFVYPLIEESEKLSLKNAQDMYEKLKTEIFPGITTGLIHSRLPEDEKERTMAQFVKNEIRILVATSVVEVGVDVPNANCMVIEHAERFGLSALHQLRGRVGRGVHQSYGFLIYSRVLTDDGIKRLKVMMETTDGFTIAEEDLNIRGPGELLGVQQSGFLKFRCAHLARDIRVLEAARKDAVKILQVDPGLLKADHGVIREVLAKAPPFSAQFLDGG